MLIHFLLMIAAIDTLCISAAISSPNIFQSHLTNDWYPRAPKKLKKVLKQLTANAENNFLMDVIDDAKIFALIVPHAGYEYSGTIAAAAYRLANPELVDTIIVLAPSHFRSFKGIALPHFNRYHIPTGDLIVNEDIVHKLERNKHFSEYSDAFKPEHALEIQLPFIHYFFPTAQIVPLIVGNVSDQEIPDVARTLKKCITPGTLVIISTDLTHYGTQFQYTPFKNNVPLRIHQLDSRVLDAVQQSSLAAFKDIMKETHDTVCGKLPLEIMLSMIEQNTFSKTITRLVAYGTSSEVTHDTTTSVSYGSLIVTQETDGSINQLEKTILLLYARNILENAFTGQVPEDLLKPMMTPVLQHNQAVFVTLYKKNKNESKELRGCIGTTKADKPLYVNVAEMTRAAAFHDTRFSPVTKDELSDISIEISMLEKPYAVSSYKNIILGTHGIILTVGAQAALFLPQVATEFEFTLEQTLSELSKKAGLQRDAWKLPEARFQVFTATDFSEPELTKK